MFKLDPRLGIFIPSLSRAWLDYSKKEREEIMHKWEQVRGTIPDRIQELENCINDKQNELNEETNFAVSCRLNEEISELASIINDLWIWFRTFPGLFEANAHFQNHL